MPMQAKLLKLTQLSALSYYDKESLNDEIANMLLAKNGYKDIEKYCNNSKISMQEKLLQLTKWNDQGLISLSGDELEKIIGKMMSQNYNITNINNTNGTIINSNIEINTNNKNSNGYFGINNHKGDIENSNIDVNTNRKYNSIKLSSKNNKMSNIREYITREDSPIQSSLSSFEDNSEVQSKNFFQAINLNNTDGKITNSNINIYMKYNSFNNHETDKKINHLNYQMTKGYSKVEKLEKRITDLERMLDNR